MSKGVPHGTPLQTALKTIIRAEKESMPKELSSQRELGLCFMDSVTKKEWVPKTQRSPRLEVKKYFVS